MSTRRYVAFVDPSGGSQDSFAVAVAHQERGRAVLDLVRERRPPFSPEGTVEEFVAILRPYGVTSVTGDRYAGDFPREQFRKHGLQYHVADLTKSDLYHELLPLITSRRVELLDDRRLIAQLLNLERKTSRLGKDTISHPPRQHDDLINAAAGALVMAAGRHRKMLEEWKDAPAAARASLDDALAPPALWTCPRGCGYSGLVAPGATPKCPRCAPGWTWNQVVHGGEAVGLWMP